MKKHEACWLSVTAYFAPLHAAARLNNFFLATEAQATPKISHPHLATSFYFIITTNEYLSNAPTNFLINAFLRGMINCVSRLLIQEVF
jgi:hypothetical protein